MNAGYVDKEHKYSNHCSAGMCLGLAAFIVSPRPAFAGAIEEVPIVTDAKGSTTNLTKESMPLEPTLLQSP
eukprot:3433671-Amphidinium_carterae.1